MNKPLVSICIPNYNYGHYLRDCLESILNQTYDNIEVFFRDNHSTDDSYKIALEYREKFKKKGIFFSITENKRNLGSDKNSKLCSRDTEGDFIYTLASDDIIKPQFIEKCIEVFDKYPNVGTVITHRDEIDENGKVTKELPFYNKSCVIKGEDQAAVYMMAGIAIPGQRMVRRNILIKSSKYQRQLEVAGDWYDNFIYSCFADVAYIKDSLMQYRVHSGNETNESELCLLGSFEHYQLINAFRSISLSFDMKKPVERYDEAVCKLGDMCLRYSLKMYKLNKKDVAERYLNLATVYNPKIILEEKYIELKEMQNLNEEELERKLREIPDLKRNKSYDPPEGYIPLD